MLRDGTEVPVSHSLSSQQHYNYCTKNWCITDASESMFTYEPGYGHANITRCKHPYTDDQTLEDVPEDILDECDSFVPCIIDRMRTNAMVADRSGRTRQASSLASRNGFGGVCETDKNCFEPLKCIGLGGLQGKKCLSELPKCMWDWGDCSLVPNCCDGGVCTEIGNGQKQCRILDSCKDESSACSADADCCSGLTCRGSQCRLPCKNKLSTCSMDSECCSGLICYDGKCRSKPCNWDSGTCSADADCCTGLVCNSGKCGNPCGSATATCSSNTDCCDGLTCNGDKCEKPCTKEWYTCSMDSDCCTGLGCVGGLCKKTCKDEWAACSKTKVGDCCGAQTCLTTPWGSQVCRPTTCANAWDNCSADRPCCAGLTCSPDGQGGTCK